MKGENWIDFIFGIVEILIAIYLINNQNELSNMFCILGGYHIGKGFNQKY